MPVLSKQSCINTFGQSMRGHLFTKAIYRVDDKDFDLIIENNHIFAEGKVLFEKIIAYDADSKILTTYNHVDVKFQRFRLRKNTITGDREKRNGLKMFRKLKLFSLHRRLFLASMIQLFS